MPRFLAVHPHAFTEAQLKRLAGAKDQLPPDIKWNQTFCSPGSDRAFCDWDAPDKDAVEQVLNANDLPFVAIYRVDRLDPSTAEFDHL